MALKIGDRVRENTSSTGVGGLSLTGAPAGFQRFSAILSSGDTTYYSLEENDKFEIGIATYGSNNLERTTVLSSSNSGNKISLGGSGVVFITYPAAKAFFASEGDEFTVPSSGLVFSNGTVIKDAKLVELTDVNLSGTPVQNSVFDLNITNKSLSIGDLTGPTNSNNILIGYGAGSGITTGSDSVIIGAESSTINKTGQHNVHIGAKAGPVVSDAASSVYNSVAVGYSAGNKMRHESVAIGYEAALHAYEIGFIGIGYQVGSGLGSYSTVIGYQAGRTLGEDYAVALGYQAGYNGAGEASVWIGQGAGHSSTGSTRSIGIGKNAGKSSSGNECIYIGEGAGTSNSSNNLVFIGNSTPATNGSLVKGDMDAKRIAVGVADVTLDDTFFVGVNSANDEGIVVKAAVSQVSNLTSWKNSSDSVLASVSKDGVVSAHEIVATGNGIQIANLIPASTTNKLYNDAGSLYFNGSRLASAGSSSSIAQYASGQAVANQSNIVAVSGIAAYASGVGSSGGDVTTVQLNYVSGISVYGSGQTILNQNNITALLTASGTATSLIASSGVAAYASGQVISNQSNISTNTSRVTYASGQAISNQSNITTNTSNISTNTSNISTNTSRVTYASGQAIANKSDIATNTSSISSNTGNISSNTNKVNYASGQAIENESDITALLTASGTATSLVASSGIANYASGQAVANEGDLVAVSGIASYASGVSLTVKEADGSPNVSNVRTIVVSNGTLTDDGAGQVTVTTGGGGGGGDVTTDQLNYVSGIAVYSSGQAIENESDITALLTASGTATSLIASSGIATYASGQAIANESDIATNTSSISTNNSNIVANTAKVNYASGQAVSNQSNISALLTASGTATSLISSSGIANYASGQAIENESLATYASGQVNIITDGTAEASKALVLDSSKSFTGVKDGRFSQFDSFVYSTGVSVGNSGVLLERNTPGVTTDTLYNVGGTLYFNGSQLASAGGASATAQYASGQATSLNTASGVATYASGQAITNESDIVATSGIANYASGQAILNQGNITALLTASGTATSLIASSGIATYASGQAVANESDIVAVSGIATNKFTVTASDSNNYTFNGMGLSNGLDPDLYLHKGHTYYFDKQTASHPFRVSATDGGSVYQDAAGNSIEISGQGVLKFEVPQNAPDKLYYYCTSHASNMKGEIYTTNNVDEIIHVSGIAAYASGQAIENESDIVAVSGIAAFSSGVVTDVDVIIGQVSTTAGTGIAIGYGAGLDSSIDKANALNGYKASDVLIGHFAGSGYIHHAPTSTALSSEQQNVMIGFKAGANSLNYRGGSTALGDNVYIGVEAGHTASGYHRVCIGDEAAHSSSGIRVVAIGAKCFEHSEGDDNTAVGYRAGGYSTGDHNLYLGRLAGFGVIGANNIELLTEGPNPSLIGGNSNKIHIENTIIGDTSAKKIAIGNIAAGDLTPDATLEVKPKVASDIGVIVQGAASHSANLQEWQNNSEEVLARVEPNGVIFSSGVTASGLLLPNHVPVSTTNTLYNEGGTLKFNGSAVGGGGGDVSTAQLNYVSGIAVYASGQSQSLNTVSGVATSLIASSGIATYASGNTANIAFGSNAEGDLLYHNGTSFIRLPKGTDDYILKMNGNVPNWEAESGGSSLTAGSGVVVDGASKINIHGGTGNLQEIQLTSNNIFTPKMIFTGSGVKDTPVTLKVLSSHGAVNTSGTALSFEGTQGQLFGITDNLSSGNIFSVSDITGLPLISADASGDVKLGEYGRYVGVGTGVPLYGFDVSSSGQFQKGFVLSNYAPATTTNTLYNEGGTLKFNGAATYAPLLTASGAAVYASGQVNVSSAGTAVASKALVLDSAKSFTGTKHGVFNEFDSRVTASGVTIGASGITLTGGAYVQEAVPANDTPATEDATITLDLLTGNYHNVVLGANVTKFEFTNAKRGQRFLLRITQHASSAKTIAWTNVDYTTGGAAATVRWAGGGTAPTMSTATSHTDVYGFLCTNNAGSAFDGFVVGQNLPD